MFSFFNIKKEVKNEDDLKNIRNTQYLVKFLMLLSLVSGIMMLVGGIFCIAAFDVEKTTSILLIVFGLILSIVGGVLVLILKNIDARIAVYKGGEN